MIRIGATLNYSEISRAIYTFNQGEKAEENTLEFYAHLYALEHIGTLFLLHPGLLYDSDAYFFAYFTSYEMGLICSADITTRTDRATDERYYAGKYVQFISAGVVTRPERWRIVEAMTNDRYLVQRHTYFGKIISCGEIVAVSE